MINCNVLKNIKWIPVFLIFSFLTPILQNPCFAYDNKNVHPYIAEQAFKIWPNDINHPIATFLGSMRGDRSCADADTGGYITEGAIEEDIKFGILCYPPDFTIFYHHFYNPDNPNDSTNGLNYGNTGSRAIARSYWTSAQNNYWLGNKGLAFWYWQNRPSACRFFSSCGSSTFQMGTLCNDLNLSFPAMI